MKLPIPIFVATILLGAHPDRALVPRFEQCVDPATTAKALARIQLNNWRDLSAARLVKLWPDALDEEKCATDGALGCRILETRDRTKNGDWGCGEAFVFKSERGKDGLLFERLDNVFVHYSDVDRKEVVAAGRVLARGIGVPEGQIATLGQDSYQRFEWSKTVDDAEQGYLAEAHFTRNDDVWGLLLSVSRR